MLFAVAGYMPETANAETAAIWSGETDVDWYDGELTEMHISTAEELAGLAALVNSGKTMTGQTIILDSDIILNDASDFDNWSSKAPANDWTSIGYNSDYYFNGTFDGDGHTITGLYDYCEEGFSGLFGKLNPDGTISNISCEYNWVLSISGYNSSVICATNYGTITNCVNNGNVYSPAWRSGGICCYNGGRISNCINNGDVYSYDSDVGGICACNNGTISNCINNGYIYCETTYSDTSDVTSGVGGICGCTNNKSFSIENCYNQGDVKGHMSGGIVGYCDSKGKISNVYNTGTISGTLFAGGILGYITSVDYLPDMTACYYLGSASVKGIGNASSDDYTISKNSAGMRSEAFVKSLGDAFVYNPDGYPMLAWEVNENIVLFETENVTLKKIGETAALKLITNYSGTPVWISSDTDVVTVENGVVTAVSDGTATIYAICGDTQATCTVTVTITTAPPSSEISLNHDKLTMGVGETATLEVLNYDGTCTWLSSDTKIAKISGNGFITAAGKGEVLIYAMLSNGKTLICNVSVTEKMASIADVVLLQKFLVKKATLTVRQMKTADINNDGDINVIDLVILKRKVLYS